MEKTYITTVFMNGGSQAIRIPKELRFDTDKVSITRNPITGFIEIRPVYEKGIKTFIKQRENALIEIEEKQVDLDSFLKTVKFGGGKDVAA